MKFGKKEEVIITDTVTLGGLEFVKVGSYKKKTSRNKGSGKSERICLELDIGQANLVQKKGVYTFIETSKATIRYIGKSLSERGVKSRLDAHHKSTNNKANTTKKYTDFRKYLHNCDVYVHIPKNTSYKGLAINPSSSIEEALIEKYKPTANTIESLKNK